MLLTDRAVLSYVANHPECSRSQVRRDVAPDASASTVWRALRRLVDDGLLEVVGEGRGTRYRVAGGEAVLAHLRTPIHRRPRARYRAEFAGSYRPNESRYLTDADRAELMKAGTPALEPYHASMGATYARRVHGKLAVDISWASSRLERNSYDYFETDSLVRARRIVDGKSLVDAVMILNHKSAIRHVVENLAETEIRWPDLRDIHALLSNRLIRDRSLVGALRRAPVTIGTSVYMPLEDRTALRKELDILLSKAARIRDPFEQSFFLLVHIPYLQPFADVNNRTSRIASNIPLLKADLAPMSFFAINDHDYIRGLLGVYELNDVSLLREAFVKGYVETARRYRNLRPVAIHIEKVGVIYRHFTNRAVRRCILRWRGFEPRRVWRMIEDAAIPLVDQQRVLDFVESSFRTLHPGIAVLYGVEPEALEGLELEAEMIDR
ncbi:MAG: hypothetical protein F4Z31_02815 [Gemmatimonadetes bacterium]|nr:Fic family protein [Gemmatimonadota bacterium]MYA40675.1 hypothetical protein [Gemmatimonadota bacterium]MYE91999.1 hypothetical protein [Gemmatimonadota bacterium]MYJ11490.1 hypothetical protein [Gemmatimonadota bacterium]